MENPKSWNSAVKAISAAMSEWRDNQDQGIIGTSLPMSIYNYLLDRGFIHGDHPTDGYSYSGCPGCHPKVRRG